MTNVSWSRSCARLRRSLLWDPQCPDHSLAGAAPATTPASPTITTKVCSWRTRLPTLPHTCERTWVGDKDWTDQETLSKLSLVWMLKTLRVGCISCPAFIHTCVSVLLALLLLFVWFWVCKVARMFKWSSTKTVVAWFVVRLILSSFPSEKDCYDNHWRKAFYAL